MQTTTDAFAEIARAIGEPRVEPDSGGWVALELPNGNDLFILEVDDKNLELSARVTTMNQSPSEAEMCSMLGWSEKYAPMRASIETGRGVLVCRRVDVTAVSEEQLRVAIGEVAIAAEVMPQKLSEFRDQSSDGQSSLQGGEETMLRL